MASPSVTLSSPYPIFPLALPLHRPQSKGDAFRKCHTSAVDSKKRKRTGSAEVAAAIDGEGVNIYDVRSTQTVSSYALQPTTTFSCAPASTVARVSATCSVRRTYVATSQPRKQIFCWKETVHLGSPGGDEADAANPVKTLSASIASQQPVVYLRDLGALARRGKKKETGAERGVLAVHADGQLRVLSEDLQSEKWCFSLPQPAGGHSQTVVYAATTGISTARKALLKNRPDVALPNPAAEGNDSAEEDIILLLVTQRETGFDVHLALVPTTGETRSASRLLSLPLPATSNPTEATFSMHFPTGTLYQLSSKQLISYDLIPVRPAVSSALSVPTSSSTPNAPPPSLLRISSSTVLVATPEDVSLYDTKFCSLQARVAVHSSSSSSATSTTISRDTLSRSSTPAGGNVTGAISLTTYIPELDMAVGYSQTGIIAVQLSRAGRNNAVAEKGAKGSLLIDSLSRGIGGLQVGKPRTKPKRGGVLADVVTPEIKRMEQTLQALRAARKADDVVKFEETFSEYVGYKPDKNNSNKRTEAPPQNNTAKKALVNGVTNRDRHDAVPRTTLPTSTDSIPREHYKPLRSEFVKTVLSLIFTLSKNDSEPETQEITFFPPRVLKYLLESSNFSTLSLPVQDALVKTLAEFDPSLHTLQWFLKSLAHLSPPDLAFAIQIALPRTTRSSPGGGGGSEEVHRTEVLQLAFLRLSTLPSTLMIQTLQRLSSDDLLLLITLLEAELVALGASSDPPNHTQPSPDAPPSINLPTPGMIADMLSAALDTVGIANVVLATNSTDRLSLLEHDVATAIAAVEAEIHLKGVLEELFRHVDWQGMKADENAERERARALRERNRIRRERKERRKAEYAAAHAPQQEQEQEQKQQEQQQRANAASAQTENPPATGPTPALPNTAPSLPKKKPAQPSTRKNKLRRSRADATSQNRRLARIRAQRRTVPALAGTRGKNNSNELVGGVGVTRKDLLKRGARPTARTAAASALLPLGAERRKRAVDPVVTKQLDRMRSGTGRRVEYWKEGLAAGVYSVESMVV